MYVLVYPWVYTHEWQPPFRRKHVEQSQEAVKKVEVFQTHVNWLSSKVTSFDPPFLLLVLLVLLQSLTHGRTNLERIQSKQKRQEGTVVEAAKGSILLFVCPQYILVDSWWEAKQGQFPLWAWIVTASRSREARASSLLMVPPVC